MLNVGFQLGDPALQRLTAEAGGLVHAGMVAKGGAFSCAPGRESSGQRPLTR